MDTRTTHEQHSALAFSMRRRTPRMTDADTMEARALAVLGFVDHGVAARLPYVLCAVDIVVHARCLS